MGRFLICGRVLLGMAGLLTAATWLRSHCGRDSLYRNVHIASSPAGTSLDVTNGSAWQDPAAFVGSLVSQRVWDVPSAGGGLMISYRRNDYDFAQQPGRDAYRNHFSANFRNRGFVADRIRIIGTSFLDYPRLDGSRAAPACGVDFRSVHTSGAGWESVYQGVICPYWLLMLVSVVPLCVSLLRSARSWFWLQNRCCGRCGYDLRGNNDSGRCPECGEAPPQRTRNTF